MYVGESGVSWTGFLIYRVFCVFRDGFPDKNTLEVKVNVLHTTVAKCLDHSLGLEKTSAKFSSYPGPWGKLNTRSSVWGEVKVCLSEVKGEFGLTGNPCNWDSRQIWHVRYTQSCCCPLQEDVIENHRETFFHAPFQNYCKIQDKWIMFLAQLKLAAEYRAIDLCWQSNDNKIVTIAWKVLSYSHKTTTHSLLDDKLIKVSWTPPVLIP